MQIHPIYEKYEILSIYPIYEKCEILSIPE